jgi:hypothetical protein
LCSTPRRFRQKLNRYRPISETFEKSAGSESPQKPTETHIRVAPSGGTRSAVERGMTTLHIETYDALEYDIRQHPIRRALRTPVRSLLRVLRDLLRENSTER